MSTLQLVHEGFGFTTTTDLTSHASKVMLKILQARLQQYMNWEIPDVQAGFRKGRGTRGQIANVHWILEKAREIQKDIFFCFTDYTKTFDSVDHNKLWKILKEMGVPDHLPVFWETWMQVEKQQLEPCMEQLIGSRWRKYKRAVCRYSIYLTYTLSTSWEMPGWMSHKLKSR